MSGSQDPTQEEGRVGEKDTQLLDRVRHAEEEQVTGHKRGSNQQKFGQTVSN